MPLTREQFNSLLDEGLTVDQIVAFERGETPQTMAPQEQEGFFKGVVTDPLETLVVKPAVRFGQAVGSAFLGQLGVSPEVRAQAAARPVKVPGTGITIAGQKQFGQGGGRQIIGDIAKTGSYLYTGGQVPAITSGFGGQVFRSAVNTAKTTGIGGGLYSFGEAVSVAENQPSSIAYQTMFGALAGAGLGFTLGAAFPVTAKIGSKIKQFSKIDSLNSELRQLNNKTLNPTPSQAKNWSQQKVNPIKTYTEIFETEVPDVDKQNRFIKESVEDFIQQVDDIYRPGSEGFNTILRNSPERVSITSAYRSTINSIKNSGLTPKAKNQALARVKDEYDAILNEVGRKNNIPVAYADHLKDRFWRATKYFGPEEASITNEVNRAWGRSFASLIEDTIKDVNVRNYNKQLQELIILKDFLASKIGKLAGDGGKMTRLFSRAIGGVAGSGGGPIGSVVGSITGDMLAQFWINPANSPYRWFIMRQLRALPQAERIALEQQANEIIKRMYQRRIQTLALPPASRALAPRGKLGSPLPSTIKTPAPTTFEPPATQIGQGGARSVSTELQPLLQEARKYKTAEEFVRAQESKYRGIHEAPTRADGDSVAPAYALDKIYPTDIYSSNATRYYSSGMPYDAETISTLQSIKGKPNATITVYRAVPGTKTNAEMIAVYEAQKKAILKNGKIPDVEMARKYNLKDSSSYYDFIDNEIQRLRGATEPKVEKYAINEGDWVTPNRKYAVDHGMSNLGGNYKILSKKVRADELFTDANSIQEFGYSPRESSLKTKSQLIDIWNKANKKK